MKDLIFNIVCTVVVAIVAYLTPESRVVWCCLGLCSGTLYCSIISHIANKKVMKELDSLLEEFNVTQKKQ